MLIQGETSVGKTSLINWLAKASGNHCVRINNHEHTDIQEYLGCYTSDETGKLVFKEGKLWCAGFQIWRSAVAWVRGMTPPCHSTLVAIVY